MTSTPQTFMEKLIRVYKRRKKNAFFRQPLFQSHKQYAFIGVGMYSLSNLYPVLHYFNISLKYIYTPSSLSAEELSARFPHSIATHQLNDILQDREVDGAFVCTIPALHFQITQQLLEAGKHVFLEKPPCYSLADLKTLDQTRKGLSCFVNLQKRFGTANQLITAKLSTATYYHCRYATGPYPEGNPVYELFIHPIDNCIRLFGNARIRYLKKIPSGGSTTFLLTLEHGPITGMIELSTGYSWTNPVDTLVIHTKEEILTVRYPNFVQGEERSKSIGGLPLEKIRSRPAVFRNYLNNEGIIPSMENNSLFVQGFVPAISHFISEVEKNNPDRQYQPESLYPVYEILDALNHATGDFLTEPEN